MGVPQARALPTSLYIVPSMKVSLSYLLASSPLASSPHTKSKNRSITT